MKLRWIALATMVASTLATAAFAEEKPIKIALVVDKTGPLEAYAKQTLDGFAMGLEYATGGTMAVAGRSWS